MPLCSFPEIAMLHIPTLLLANSLVMGLSGALLLFSWWRGREERTLLWMGGLLLLGVLGVMLSTLRGLGFDYVAIVFGNMVVLLATGMQWTAVRLFCGRRVLWTGLLTAPLLWAALCVWPTFYQNPSLRMLVYSALVVVIMAFALRELLRSRHQLPVSTVPALVLMVCHLLFFALRPFLDPVASPGAITPSLFFGWVVIEGMLYAIGAGFVMLAMVKERAEAHYRNASLTDPLTQIGNRRAFAEAAQRMFERVARRAPPLSLLICDLDNFKRVNDQFGHPGGDLVLQGFARVLREQLDGVAVYGRIGGEEFACLVEGDGERARVLAERIRTAFTLAVREFGALSVSIGVATAPPSELQLSHMLAQADAALYRAKREGRDRVELASQADIAIDAANAEQRRRFR
jgi:diguanylate cyclase (GGDEF)-like protein